MGDDDMSEMDIVKRIMLRASELGHTVWRVNTGLGWAGKSTCRKEKDGTLTVIIRDARPLRAGLCQGGSDIIGVSKDGKFLAIEGKTDRGEPSKDQLNFINHINSRGGVAGIARSPEDLDQILLDRG